jgi:hypothetical protein
VSVAQTGVQRFKNQIFLLVIGENVKDFAHLIEPEGVFVDSFK